MYDERHYWWLKRDYIKKCRFAHPIQAWWKTNPQLLDLPVREGRSKRVVSNITLGDIFSFSAGHQVCVVTGTIIHVPIQGSTTLEYTIEGMRGGNYSHQAHERFLESGFMWIPSFQRLYDFWSDLNGLPVSEFMSRFLSWYDKEQIVLEHVDEYGIHFVMEDSCEMVWTGESWIT